MGKRITILTKKGAIIMKSRLGEILYYTIQIVNQFPYMPQELLANGGLEIGISNSRKTSLSLKPKDSAFVYTICNSWNFYYTFDLIYQCACITNDDRLNAIDFLSALTHWLVGNSTYNSINVKKLLPITFNGGSLDRFAFDNDATLFSREANGIELFSSGLKSVSTLAFEDDNEI